MVRVQTAELTFSTLSGDVFQKQVSHGYKQLRNIDFVINKY